MSTAWLPTCLRHAIQSCCLVSTLRYHYKEYTSCTSIYAENARRDTEMDRLIGSMSRYWQSRPEFDFPARMTRIQVRNVVWEEIMSIFYEPMMKLFFDYAIGRNVSHATKERLLKNFLSTFTGNCRRSVMHKTAEILTGRNVGCICDYHV